MCALPIWAKVVDRLADADRVDRQAVPLGRGDEDAAARGAVEPGHDEAGDPRDLAEYVDLRQRLLPRRRVEDAQHDDRPRGVEAAQQAFVPGVCVARLALGLTAALSEKSREGKRW